MCRDDGHRVCVLEYDVETLACEDMLTKQVI